MAKIKEIIGMDNKGSHALVHVITDDGTECTIWIGGQVELFFDHKYNKVKAFVKKVKT
jgi:hypothetical protein